MCTEGRGGEESDCESCIHMFSVLIYAIFCLFDLHLCCFELKLSPSPLPAPALLSSNELENFYVCFKWMERIKRGFYIFRIIKANLYVKANKLLWLMFMNAFRLNKEL